MSRSVYVFDPTDPRAPSEEQWAAMSEPERAKVVDQLPSDPMSGTRARAEALTRAIDRAETRVVAAEQRVKAAEERAARLAAQLRALGVEPEA